MSEKLTIEEYGLLREIIGIYGASATERIKDILGEIAEKLKDFVE